VRGVLQGGGSTEDGGQALSEYAGSLHCEQRDKCNGAGKQQNPAQDFKHSEASWWHEHLNI
jgi:hypothetical protein